MSEAIILYIHLWHSPVHSIRIFGLDFKEKIEIFIFLWILATANVLKILDTKNHIIILNISVWKKYTKYSSAYTILNWFGHLLLVEAIYLSKGQAEPENSIIFRFSLNFLRAKNIFILGRFKIFWMFWKAMSLNRSFLQV